MSIAPSRGPLPILTSLRFFAAAEVVIFHEVYSSVSLPGTPAFLRDLMSAGYEAVTFFFILSGFILTYVYANSAGLSVPRDAFWRARAARILPAYFLALLIAFPHLLYAVFISKTATVVDLVLVLTLVPMGWNAPAWSLSVEFFFYALFPFLLPVALRVRPIHFALGAYGLVVAVAALRLVTSSPDAGFDTWLGNFQQFFPLFHLPQFIFGMALGRLYLAGTLSPKAHTVMLYAGAIGTVLVIAARSAVPDWTLSNIVLAALFGLVIYGGARANVKTLAAPALLLLGEASYAMYVLHMPLGWWWNWAVRAIEMPVIVNFALYFALVITASVTTYLYVERPLRRWILGHREHRAG